VGMMEIVGHGGIEKQKREIMEGERRVYVCV